MVYGGEIVYLMVLYQSKRSARRSQDEWCGLRHIGTHLFREYNHQWFSFPLSVEWYNRRNAQRMEDAFYNRENLNPQMKGADAGQTANTVAVPEGVDADLLMKVLGNPEMAALLTSLAKSLKAE